MVIFFDIDMRGEGGLTNFRSPPIDKRILLRCYSNGSLNCDLVMVRDYLSVRGQRDQKSR